MNLFLNIRNRLSMLLCLVLSSITALAGDLVIISDHIEPFQAKVGSEHEQYYFIEGTNFGSGQIVNLDISDPNFTISSGGSYESSLQFIASSSGSIDGQIAIKYAPLDSGPHNTSIVHSGNEIQTMSVDLNGSTGSLPVSFIFFKVKMAGSTLVLDWATASERNNNHFDLEMMTDLEKGFERIGRVPSKDKNTMSVTVYRFEHPLVDAFGTYYFRLKQVDLDGTYVYSETISLALSEKQRSAPKLAPNPATIASQLHVFSKEPSQMNVKISNMKGEEVYQKVYGLRSGENSFLLDLDDHLKSGLYILTTEINGKVSRLRLLK